MPEIRIENLAGATCIVVNGRLDAAGAPDLEQQAKTVSTSGSLIVDLSGVPFVSSAGLRVLLILAKQARAANGQLILCGLQPAVQEVLVLSGFDNVLQWVENREAALARLG